MPKGTPERTAARREEIIRACEKLYQTMSFKEITLKEIGSETSFSRPTIYNYFQTKEEIFLALFELEYDRWNEDLGKILEENEALEREEIYTKDDLNWMNKRSRSSVEMSDPAARPAIRDRGVNMQEYDTVIIGFPIWWGEEPRILDTFVESHSFDGITVIPFCTSGSSGIGNSGQNLEKNAGSGIWLEGRRLASGTSKEDIAAWISGLQ